MNISCITAADNSTDAMEMKHQSQIVIDECDSNTYDYSENPKDITGRSISCSFPRLPSMIWKEAGYYDVKSNKFELFHEFIPNDYPQTIYVNNV